MAPRKEGQPSGPGKGRKGFHRPRKTAPALPSPPEAAPAPRPSPSWRDVPLDPAGELARSLLDSIPVQSLFRPRQWASSPLAATHAGLTLFDVLTPGPMGGGVARMPWRLHNLAVTLGAITAAPDAAGMERQLADWATRRREVVAQCLDRLEPLARHGEIVTDAALDAALDGLREIRDGGTRPRPPRHLPGPGPLVSIVLEAVALTLFHDATRAGEAANRAVRDHATQLGVEGVDRPGNDPGSLRRLKSALRRSLAANDSPEPTGGCRFVRPQDAARGFPEIIRGHWWEPGLVRLLSGR